MSTDKPTKKTRSTKTKADLEAKIAELESKLNALAAQAKPAETKPTPPPAPKPQVQQKPAPSPKPEIQQKPTLPKPEGQQPSKAEITQTSSTQAEVASAYANTSSSGYTGNRYYATRQRLAYHPPDKQFTGQVTVQVSRPAPPPAPEPEPVMVEPEPQKQKEEPRRIEPPTPTVKYTGENYYRTRQRLAYHPPDKQFIGTVAVKFDESPTVSQVESTSSQSNSSQSTSSSQKKSRNEELEEYEKEYLERLKQQRVEAETPQPESSEPSPHGTMPAGWKP